MQISVTAGSRYDHVWANVISVTRGGVSNFQKKANYVKFSAHKVCVESGPTQFSDFRNSKSGIFT